MKYCIPETEFNESIQIIASGPHDDCSSCETSSSSSAAPISALFRVSDGFRDDFFVKINGPQLVQSARMQISRVIEPLSITGIIIKSRANYNPNYSYHYDPDTVDFFEVAIEVCDSTFAYTEEHLAEAGGAFLPGNRLCPWGSFLVEEVLPSPLAIVVTVASGTNSSGTGNKYHLDGSVSPVINMTTGATYTLDVSHPSNSNHPLRFSTTPNGTHAGGAEYNTGVSRTSSPGQTGSTVTIVAPSSPTTLYYYCQNHPGMGSGIGVQ